jgi:hypothetical protein
MGLWATSTQTKRTQLELQIGAAAAEDEIRAVKEIQTLLTTKTDSATARRQNKTKNPNWER